VQNYTLNNTQCKNQTEKNETAVNFVKPNNRTLQLLQNWIKNHFEVIFANCTPAQMYMQWLVNVLWSGCSKWPFWASPSVNKLTYLRS